MNASVIQRNDIMWVYENFRLDFQMHNHLQCLIEAQNQKYIKRICEFIDIDWQLGMGDNFHVSSIQKWRKDRQFGFQLSDRLMTLASHFGYNSDDISNERKSIWFISRTIHQNSFKFRIMKNDIKKNRRNSI